MNNYLHNFVATRNTKTSAALGELALVILRCRTEQFCGTCCRRACLEGDNLSSFKSAINCTYRGLSFILFIFRSLFAWTVPVYRNISFPSSMCYVILVSLNVS